MRGVDGVFVPERGRRPQETVAKASAGAIEHVGRSRHNLSLLIKQLKERNVWVIGTAADASMEYTEWTGPDLRPGSGGEGAGLHRLIRERCMCCANSGA